jgi:small subunit ribosomal protein S21
LVIRVQTRDNEPVEKALRRLRKLCNNEGVTRTSKAKSFFEKPSERRRREARERRKAIRLSMRAQRSDTAKLLNRRRKARKNARAAQRNSENEAPQTDTKPAAAAAPAAEAKAPENQANAAASTAPATTPPPTTPAPSAAE